MTVSKPNFASETRTLSIEVAETKPLFFKLEPIPAHLTIHTQPSSAALFVRGNRTQNPYVQDVPPGSYEIYAEAPYFLSKRESILLGPGETREVSFPLTYAQRSRATRTHRFLDRDGRGQRRAGGTHAKHPRKPHPKTPLHVNFHSRHWHVGGRSRVGCAVVDHTTRSELHPR